MEQEEGRTQSIPARDLRVGMFVCEKKHLRLTPLEVIRIVNVNDRKAGVQYMKVIVTGHVLWRTVAEDEPVIILVTNDGF